MLTRGDLGTRVILVSFHSDGIFPIAMDILKSLVVAGAMLQAVSLSIKAVYCQVHQPRMSQ